MTIEITVPELGESVLEATVSHWLKKEGDFVNVGDVLVELETDKVNLEVGAKAAGVLEKIAAPDGADVKVGDVLGRIDEKAAEPQSASAGSRAEQGAAATQKTEEQKADPPQAEAQKVEPVQTKEPQPKEQGATGRGDGQQMERQAAPQVSPVAARLARDKNVDISKIAGTGNEGRVTKADVEMYLQRQETAQVAENAAPPVEEQPAQAEPLAAPSTADRREERRRMSRRRRTIAQRLLEATQNTAMLTTFNEIDMTAVMDIRKRHNEEFQKRYGIKLGFMSFFAKASISALKAFPEINAQIDGEEIVYKYFYDIGIAVGSSEGLVVPVIRDAERLSFAEIEQRIKDLVEKTEQGKLSIEDLRGGTFTITNGGVFGSLLSTPILNPPQVGILGLHKIEERPVAMNGQVVVRPMMYVALSYDHRIVDGREAVQFLVHIKQMLEDPAWMLVAG